METQPLIVERTYPAAIEKVWKAITNKEQMKQWYFDLADFKAEKGFKFQFYGGTEEKQFLHVCEVLEVDEPNKLAHSWTYDGYPGYSVVTWELFEEEENKTRVRLTHTGLESFPQDAPDFLRSNFEMGWNSLVGEMLPGFLAKA